MILIDEVRKRFEAAGYRISPRDDVTEAGAAWFLGIAAGTLGNWRTQKRAPRHIKLGSGTHYPIEGLLDWLARRMSDAA